ncbi:MAG TPA: selenium cofactor biosynthesis protein YqeC [Anaerolineae bacterium]|nr:selenium cofactor biosynthesis protein YqeC [Anaerolineae bacterium]HOR00665.1 selenium cofactor biosynthesis protein YqeC [Anaerolineae bacterium]HPL28814.1 selenium cofactor biosynthesis protein YqeC [Anaerolineae bacterium]
MRLTDALGLGAREVVALVGAGGKTSALYQLARELRACGRTVIATTTTHMWPPPPAEGWPLALGAAGEARNSAAAQALAAQGRAFVAAGPAPSGRLLGIAPEEVAGLASLADAVLVEADGARGLWIKAPAAHEPVIPGAATVVVPVVGLQAVGRALDATVAHRPERVAALVQVAPASAITEDMVARLLTHEHGGLRGAPPQARVVPLCNQADDGAALAAGRRIAARILQSPGRVQRVAVCSVQAAPQACEAWQPSAAIILAAGGARRYGRLKQAELWHGQPFLVRAVDAALASSVAEVHVVLGCEAGRLAALLDERKDARLRISVNPAWSEGQANSLRMGLASLSAHIQSAVFCMADQPMLTGREIDALLQRHAASGATIVAPRCQGTLRSPVLFARRHFAELAALQGDTGGRAVIRRHPGEAEALDVEDPRPYADVDTTRDYEELKGN